MVSILFCPRCYAVIGQNAVGLLNDTLTLSTDTLIGTLNLAFKNKFNKIKINKIIETEYGVNK